ncbi:MAG TPA: nucleoside-diphosphate sugar epimerase/dehydratase [Gemmatimonadaceae bacterium]|nr:nucleoside-diphosphate sugar epimerase/dehydratase [Gemmatimonadaceae bacterium]
MTLLRNRLPALRNRAFFASDLVLLPLSAVIAFAARFDGLEPTSVREMLEVFVLSAVPLKIALLLWLGMYRRLWRYASVADVELLLVGAGACALVDIALGTFGLRALGLVPGRLSYGVILLDACLGALAIALPRLGIRVVRRERRYRDAGFRRTIVVGAGAAGGMIVRELLENAQLGMVPVAILDDDPRKHGLRLNNVPVLGDLRALSRVAKAIEATEVVIAMPTASGRTIREVVREARGAGLGTRTVPGLYEILSGEKYVNALRQIEIQDLLRREPISTDIDQVASLVRDRVVMITGAGGSIGSELCRQVARLGPTKIVAVGRGENSIFELLHEMGRSFPHVSVQPVIADVRDYGRMEHVIGTHRPYSVFHAAAHKHVPLMEANVAEAVLNNVLGTKNVVTLSSEFDVKHFVFISTDKAVRPTSVMGASKRVAEHLVHHCALERKSGYVSVRFGNVLGSRGSVVPTFMRQIADGGPVTITHPDMTRYFMTIPEAVQLVLQAGAFGDHGEVFVLDMGEPVRIFDLALDLIRLSGLEPGADIEVHFTGSRPGEKLYEELFFKGAYVVPTDHPKILRARDAEAGDASEEAIAVLIDAARENRSASYIRRLLSTVVPEYLGPPDTREFETVDDSNGTAADERFERAALSAAQLQTVRSGERGLG